jgi:hypothetical protein
MRQRLMVRPVRLKFCVSSCVSCNVRASASRMPGAALLENSSNSSLSTKRVSPEGGISKLRPRATLFLFFGLRGGVGCPVLVAVTAGGNIASAKSQPTGPNMQPKVVW